MNPSSPAQAAASIGISTACYALQCELRPATASVVARMPAAVPPSHARRRANALDPTMSVARELGVGLD